MTRPQIIRADTIDLQNTDNPSAKDHSRQPTRPAPLGSGPPAPHQSLEIRKVEEGADDVPPSPRHPERLHDPYHSDFYGDSDDDDLGGQLQHDHSAGHLNGGMVHEDDMDDDDDLDDDMMDKISSSPSIDDEDIDFEFVYALHTFVATVEGQANATKGDTMVLLDDSNSYWWLVRVVKDGSIGYLPAEHIETPTERLARLNKHRNIDLSATMLGDNPEKSKNPLKKAMRRRNAKTVQFTAPTYVEPSDNEYSSDEEDDEMAQEHQQEEVAEQAEVQDEQNTEREVDVVEPLNVRSNKTETAAQGQAAVEEDGGSLEKTRSSEELSDRGETAARSRNGTVRNTDSFFKDDSVETKKISLTPNLLRDDSGGSLDRELTTRGSSDSFEKVLAATPKEDKKRKEKKGMLSGLFKRKDKDKKGKQDDGDDDVEKISSEYARSSPQPKESYDSGSNENIKPKMQARGAASQSPQRSSSKLQKSPPQQISPTKTDVQTSGMQTRPENGRKDSAIGVQDKIEEEEEPEEIVVRSPRQMEMMAGGIAATAAAAATTAAVTSQPEPQVQPQQQQIQPQTEATHFQPPPEQARQVSPEKPTPVEALDDSPVHVSPLYSQSNTSTTNTSNHPPDLIRDSSSIGEPGSSSSLADADADAHSPSHSRTHSPISPSSSPDILGASASKSANATPTSSTTQHSVWSDASLRAYMDDGSDIRDLMMIVHDTSHVVPAPMDHPLLVDLFGDERRRLGQMQERLDQMMVEFWEGRVKRRNAGNGIGEEGLELTRASSEIERREEGL